MVRDAEQHAAEDSRRREDVELRNRGDGLVYAAEKLLRDVGDRLPSDVKLEIENQAQALRQAVERNDAAAIRSQAPSLEQALQRAGEVVYGAAGARTGAATGQGDQQPPPEGTVEGEFREV
jgi:molecular chaperone DnaK